MRIVVGKAPDIRKIIGNIKIKRNKVFREIAPIAKADIKTELRSPKTGASKSARRTARYSASPARRSASGESLARDTGRSEKLITTSKEANKLDVGFLENPWGLNYVAYNEEERNRPTIKHSYNKTLPKIIAAVNRNFKL